jgi:Zn-dependent protease with chaperone function/RNA polymerase subunit RPABC4/transcription elongation factor Spt4
MITKGEGDKMIAAETETTLREFPHLSPAAFQHPSDVQAVAGLQKVPLLAPVIRAISSSIFEKQIRLMSISSFIRLGPNQARSVYQKFEKAAAILDLPELPELYVSSQYTINAMAFGIKKYQITLFAGLIDFLTEEELLAVIGHELGHVKCQHMLYKTVAYILRYFGAQALYTLLPAGTATLATIPLQLAILEWERKAELSCDRAALLVVQDPKVVASALAKLAGGSKKILPELNLDEVLQQATEYHETSDGLIEQLFKVNVLLQQTHPFPIVRAKEIMDWAGSEQYQNILAGNYAQNDDSPALLLAESMARVCPKCGKFVNASAPICLACGSDLKAAKLVCAKCHIKVFSTWQTCPGCGSQLSLSAQEVIKL